MCISNLKDYIKRQMKAKSQTNYINAFENLLVYSYHKMQSVANVSPLSTIIPRTFFYKHNIQNKLCIFSSKPKQRQSLEIRPKLNLNIHQPDPHPPMDNQEKSKLQIFKGCCGVTNHKSVFFLAANKNFPFSRSNKTGVMTCVET